ncbi:conserved hypothetical protein [Chthoniobacter flavus Ellin428]|uniref:Integron gene cassette protein n=1 Tax=Chthoniobacter flavus Ellin428 TaxID=497964 RepID=B4DBW0_9BACT|nr:hypothetical protein [Chthoniobacter flavus]EDY16076.1 conserved hypothetical protein [Chthoniobacter flavus Ellin428]TCO83857.1 hypothetical protein EV701_14013 [Chthoniobacter flavus]
MALRQQGQHSYGDSHADIRERLLSYSTKNGYPAEHFADASCKCGSHLFRLLLDDNEGAAVRICSTCSNSHPMGDSEEYLEDANLEECECPCGSGSFEVTVGVALYESARAVRWIYVGARCPKCGLTACYGDWKNEFDDYEQLLQRI